MVSDFSCKATTPRMTAAPIAIAILVIFTCVEVEMQMFKDIRLENEWRPEHPGTTARGAAFAAVNGQLVHATFAPRTSGRQPKFNLKYTLNVQTYTIHGTIKKKCEVVSFVNDVITLVSLESFHDNRVIVAWTELDSQWIASLNLQIINVETCKKSISHPITVSSYFSSFDNQTSPRLLVLPYEGSFDVFMMENHICNDICKLTFDNKGKKIAGPVSFLKAYDTKWSLIPINKYSASSGFFYAGHNERSADFRIINLSGEVFKTYRMNLTSDRYEIGNMAITTLDNGFAGCIVKYSQKNAQIECMHFDADLNLKVKSTMPFKHPSTIRIWSAELAEMSLQKFPGDNMLLLYSSCVKKNCIAYNINARQISPRGNYTEAVKFQDSSCSFPWGGIQVHRVSNDKYCSSYACADYESIAIPPDLQIITKCMIVTTGKIRKVKRDRSKGRRRNVHRKRERNSNG